MRPTIALLLLTVACAVKPPPVQSVPQTGSITAPGLSAPVDVVRDEEGVPHIYGANLNDAVWVEGFVMAQDRWIEMDLGRRLAEGRLAEILGVAEPSLIDQDIQMRMQNLEGTAMASFAAMQASTDPNDQRIVQMFQQFTLGVNAYLAGLKTGKYNLATALGSLYDGTMAPAWTEVDSLAIARLLCFEQSYTADGDIMRSSIQSSAATQFDDSMNAILHARAGFATDLIDLAPLDPTFTLPSGWTSSLTDNRSVLQRAASQLALLQADRPTLLGIGLDRVRAPSRGSNNWVVGPQLSADKNALLANDPHLSLSNPPTFWLVHLVARGGPQPVNTLGLAIPGVPGIALGFNQHVAWGATDSYVDCTDVYDETVVACTGAAADAPPCVVFNGKQVPLVPRVEAIGVGGLGIPPVARNVTFYDVPQHGPIIPRITAQHTVEPLSSSELSVAYTGYTASQEVRALVGLITATSMNEGVAALEKDFQFGGFNWVIADDQGHFGWTETNRIPRRAAGAIPWLIMPGDGSAEWTGDLAPQYVPHSFNPAVGFLATANNDPIGVTATNDPLGTAPVVDGVPLYVGADYDIGTRVGRITKRITSTAADHKLSLDDMQSIQADTISETGPMLAPTLLSAANALAAEIATPGSQPDLTGLVTAAPAGIPVLVAPAITAVMAWSFDTPTGVASDSPTPAQITDSQATLIYNSWRAHFETDALGDELTVLNVEVDDDLCLKLLIHISTDPTKLVTGKESNGDSILFDNLNTPTVTETKQQIAAQALLEALTDLSGTQGTDPSKWRWGNVHTLTLDGLLPLPDFSIPLSTDPNFPSGFPRHGDDGTVDIGYHGFSTTDFTYNEGPQQRLVVDMTPNGPVARNTLPGGEIFNPTSPHYADLMELWRKNQTFNVAFAETDVTATAKKELAAHGDGRVVFSP